MDVKLFLIMVVVVTTTTDKKTVSLRLCVLRIFADFYF